MKVGDYKQAKVREIIEDAVSQLMALGASIVLFQVGRVNPPLLPFSSCRA